MTPPAPCTGSPINAATLSAPTSRILSSSHDAALMPKASLSSVGGVVVGKRVAKALIEQGGDFNHGYTYSGHPVACAVALANIDILEKEGLVDRVLNETGPYLAQKFAELGHHPLVGGADTCGLVAAFALMQDKEHHIAFDESLEVGMMCRNYCFANGLIMRAVGDRMIIAPPLVITKVQIDDMIALILKCLDATLKELQTHGLMGNELLKMNAA